MNDNLLTVKEVAEIVGVTTQNIYHHMKNNIKAYVVKTDDGNKIKASIITEYYKMDLPNDLQNIDDALPNRNEELQNDPLQKEGDLQTDIPDLQINLPNEQNDLQTDLIVFLKEQIKEKDNLVKDLQSELKIEREHSRQQADRIAGLAEQIADLTRNQQVLFGMEQQKSLPMVSPSNDDIGEDAPVKNSESDKKGLFKKIFGKK